MMQNLLNLFRNLSDVDIFTLQTFTIPSFIVLNIYTLVVLVLFFIPKSYSNTSYKWKEIREWMQIFFIAFCFIVGIGAGATMFHLSEGYWYQFVGIFASFGILLAGTSFAYEDKARKRIHYVGSAMSGFAAILFMAASGYYILPVCGFAFSIILASITKFKSWMFWIEVPLLYAPYVCFYLMFVNQ